MHTAAIMGNLYQENKYSTSGDGIAQWLGNRLAGLLQRGNPRDLYTQLDYIVYELDGTEKQAKTRLLASTTLAEAVRAFQDSFERCNPTYCMENQRIQYAQEIFERNKQL